MSRNHRPNDPLGPWAETHTVECDECNPAAFPWDGLTGSGEKYEASLTVGRHDLDGNRSEFDVIVVIYARSTNAELAAKLGRRLLPVVSAFDDEQKAGRS